MLAVGLLAAALAVAIAVAVHYRAEVAALQRHPRSVAASLPPGTVPLALSSRTVTLPSYGALNGAVTIVSAKFSGGLEQIVLSAHISGGRPHTLSPSSGIGGPGVHISFTTAGRFSAFPAGDQPCTNS